MAQGEPVNEMFGLNVEHICCQCHLKLLMRKEIQQPLWQTALLFMAITGNLLFCAYEGKRACEAVVDLVCERTAESLWVETLPPRRGGRKLARGERFLRTPGDGTTTTTPPWRGVRTGVLVQILSEQVRLPLPGRVGQVSSVPGVRKKRSPLAQLPTPHWGGIRCRI